MTVSRASWLSVWLPLSLALVTGCGGDGSEDGARQRREPLVCREQPLSFMGMPGTPTQARVVGNVFAVPATLNGVQRSLVVDTGAPVTVVDPGVFVGANLPQGNGTVASMETLGLTFTDARVVGTSLPLEVPGLELGGLLGSDVLCHFSASFNYRDEQVTLGDAALPAGLEPEVAVPVGLEGGGLGSLEGAGVTEFSATRIVVEADVEGQRHLFVLDTGASLTIVSPRLFDTLTADGRATLSDVETSTLTGTTEARVTRARSFSVGGATVESAIVADVGPMFTQALTLEVGQPISGLIGGSVLRPFYVTADYLDLSLRLARYQTQDHVQDELQRVGLALGQKLGQPGYFITAVLPGTRAEAENLTLGEEVLSIDSQTLAALEPLAVEALLHGPVGQPKTVVLPSRTVTLPVEELLPLASGPSK